MSDQPNRFHVSINASAERFDATVAFYATLFGVAPAKRKPDYAKFEPAEPWVNFTLNAVPTAPPHGQLDHMGVQVWSDETLLAARDRLRDAGLALREEINVECCYAGQNKFWATDPDGRQVEFFHVLRNVEADGRRTLATVEGTSASACCAPAVTKGNDACCTPEQKQTQGTAKGCC